MDKLAEHNGGATRWTRHNRPFVLLHQEEYADAKSARQRELSSSRGEGGNGWMIMLQGKIVTGRESF